MKILVIFFILIFNSCSTSSHFKTGENDDIFTQSKSEKIKFYFDNNINKKYIVLGVISAAKDTLLNSYGRVGLAGIAVKFIK